MPRKNSKTFVPSDAVKQRISNWEGPAMSGVTRYPHSGKMVKRNNSFKDEAYYYYHAIPSCYRDKILSNQELADILYSYSYNVGNWLSAENGGIFAMPYVGFSKTNIGDGINAAGHLYRKAISPNGSQYVKQQDIWKFNPDDYYKRWLEEIHTGEGFSEYSPLKKFLLKIGLKEIDRLGTPIITRTKWIPKQHTVITPAKK